MPSIDLKPCPFCGGKPSHNSGGNSTYGRLWWAVWCDPCQVEIRDPEIWDKSNHGYLDPDYPPMWSVRKWNTRA